MVTYNWGMVTYNWGMVTYNWGMVTYNCLKHPAVYLQLMYSMFYSSITSSHHSNAKTLGRKQYISDRGYDMTS